MRAMPNLTTTSVTVTFTFDSSIDGPPYDIAACSINITYNDNSNITISGWGTEGLGTPQSSGASFSVVLADTAVSPLSGVQSWALTCIPRLPTTAASPFGNNTPTITGTGSQIANGGQSLNMGNNKIKNAGTWDWALMVQIVCADGQTVKCFGSDPEMEVGA